ncbi:MAG: tyrosine-protein phosphatase [Kiloniellales bacterium]|nr:tyrosine-protein phosphatase [Kiloniellales bacterium]
MLSVTAFLVGCSASSRHPNHVPMIGASNFRDVGGYATSDGRRVKKGVLYRSDDLSSLTREDLSTLSALGLSRVYDLRSDVERDDKPNRLPNGIPDADRTGGASERDITPVRAISPAEVEVVEIPVYYAPLDRAVSRRKIVNGEVEPGEFHRLLVEQNRAFARDYRAQWATVIRRLTEPESTPSLIHCAEGKDRTGFAVAMVLLAVGVPEETVIEDYLLSNAFLDQRASFLSSLAAVGSRFRTPASEVRPLLEVRREYLETGLATIKEDYGSYEAYIRDGLQIDEETLDKLKATLLE